MKFAYLIGSSIDISNENLLRYNMVRSFFTTEQRLAQTLATIKNIRSLDPNAAIFLIESSEKIFDELDSLTDSDADFHYIRLQDLNSELAHRVRTHGSKSHCECLMFLEFFRHHKDQLREFDYVVKLSGRYSINEKTFCQGDNIFGLEGKDNLYFIGPFFWEKSKWAHVANLYPTEVGDDQGRLPYVLTCLYCVGINQIDKFEICLAAAAALTETVNKMYYMDIEYVMYYILNRMNLLEKLRLLPWQVEGHNGQTGNYTVFKNQEISNTESVIESDKPKYAIKKFGYLPAYMGRESAEFARQFPQQVAVSFDNISTDETADFRVVVQCEPPQIYSAFPAMVRNNANKFDLILTYNKDLMDLPNHEMFVPIGCFVDELELNKTNQISYIMSSKILTNEHRMRFMILREVEDRKKIGEFDFIMHRNPPEIQSKNSFFINAKFHITCENSLTENMFSEKIIDCFRTRTIPIYYGCVNIDKFFNPQGMIRFFSIEEFRKICHEITPEWYQERLPYIEENYQLARHYWEKTVYQRVEDVVERHLNLKFSQNS
jgi:hypothetical protein